jgi:hypothetical protein
MVGLTGFQNYTADVAERRVITHEFRGRGSGGLTLKAA